MPAKIEEDNIKELLPTQQEKNEAIARYFSTTVHLLNKINDCSPEERRQRAFATWLVHGEVYASHQFSWELIADVTAHKPPYSNLMTRELSVLLDDIVIKKMSGYYTLNQLGELYAEMVRRNWDDLDKAERSKARRAVRLLIGPPKFKHKEEYLYPKSAMTELRKWLLMGQEVSA